MAEEWRPVVGWEGLYEVSSRGRVRSLPRTIVRSNGRRQTIPGRDLKLVIAANGYPVVSLWRSNKGVSSYVHVLVAAAFHGPRPTGMDICHNDGDPRNNRVGNLRYDTRQNNLMDSVRAGTNKSVKIECPRGHLKVGPNRMSYGPFKTRSVCRACKRESGLSVKYKRPFDPENADRKYQEIMEGVKWPT